MKRFKTGETTALPGAEIISEGQESRHLYTALSGMGIRFKTLPSGARQVVGFVLPGDFIGLQASITDEMRHGIEARTIMRLCVFDRDRLWDLFRDYPERAYGVTRLAAVEERLLCEALMAVGQLDGKGKVAWLLNRFYRRLFALGMERDGRVPLPYRQQDFADALGLSLVHTNKSLASLRDAGLAVWAQGALKVHDPQALAALAPVDEEFERPRPLM